jgi:hypothetical protein
MKKNIFLLLSTLVIPLLLSACTFGSTSTARSENAAAVQVETGQYLGDFQPILGTNVLYAQISQQPSAAGGIANLVSSISRSEDYGSTSNLVFLDAQTLSSHKLFEANDKIILSVIQFPDPNAGSGANTVQAQPIQAQGAEAGQSNKAVQWLVYQVTQKNANQPSAATANLPFSIAVSDADGTGYQEILSGLTKTYGITMIDGQHLLAVYTKDNVKSASVLDLAKKTVTATQPIVDLGAGVQ